MIKTVALPPLKKKGTKVVREGVKKKERGIKKYKSLKERKAR